MHAPLLEEPLRANNSRTPHLPSSKPLNHVPDFRIETKKPHGLASEIFHTPTCSAFRQTLPLPGELDETSRENPFFPAFKRIHLTGLRKSAQYEKTAERPGSKIFVADGVGGEAFRPQKNPLKIPAAAIGHVSSASRGGGKIAAVVPPNSGEIPPPARCMACPEPAILTGPLRSGEIFRRRNGCSRASSPGPTCRIPRRKSSIPRRSRPALANRPPLQRLLKRPSRSEKPPGPCLPSSPAVISRKWPFVIGTRRKKTCGR